MEPDFGLLASPAGRAQGLSESPVDRHPRNVPASPGIHPLLGSLLGARGLAVNRDRESLIHDLAVMATRHLRVLADLREATFAPEFSVQPAGFRSGSGRPSLR